VELNAGDDPARARDGDHYHIVRVGAARISAAAVNRARAFP